MKEERGGEGKERERQRVPASAGGNSGDKVIRSEAKFSNAF